METYLKTIGKQIHKVTELKSGDIVGYSNFNYGYEEVKILYVRRVVAKPDYLKWIGIHSPYVAFKVPSIGFTVSDGKIGRIHIYTQPPSGPYKHKWSEITLEEAQKQISEEECKELDYDLKDECFDLYLITDEGYKKLGLLIPDIEVPWWSALAQTVNGHQPIIDFVERTRDLFQQGREVYARIEEEVRRTV